jgi:hypothetical protein
LDIAGTTLAIGYAEIEGSFENIRGSGRFAIARPNVVVLGRQPFSISKQ